MECSFCDREIPYDEELCICKQCNIAGDERLASLRARVAELEAKLNTAKEVLVTAYAPLYEYQTGNYDFTTESDDHVALSMRTIIEGLKEIFPECQANALKKELEK